MFEITEVEITGVDCIIEYTMTLPSQSLKILRFANSMFVSSNLLLSSSRQTGNSDQRFAGRKKGRIVELSGDLFFSYHRRFKLPVFLWTCFIQVLFLAVNSMHTYLKQIKVIMSSEKISYFFH